MGVCSYEKQLEASSSLSFRTDELGSRWKDFRTICIRWCIKILVSFKIGRKLQALYMDTYKHL